MGKQAILANEYLHRAAQFVKGTRQLGGDIAAADDGDTSRTLLEGEEIIRGDAKFGTR